MWELDYKESWALKNQCFWNAVLEKTLESPLDYEEIQPVHPKRNQSRIFIGRTEAEADTPILWPPDAKKWLIGKDPDAVKDWGQEEKRATEDEMVGWHHWLNGWVWGSQKLMMNREAWRAAVHGSQRVGHNWATELNWMSCINNTKYFSPLWKAFQHKKKQRAQERASEDLYTPFALFS